MGYHEDTKLTKPTLLYTAIKYGISLVSDKLRSLKQVKPYGMLNKKLTKIEKDTALLVDDFGLQELTQECRLALLTLLQEMYEKKSLIIIYSCLWTAGQMA